MAQDSLKEPLNGGIHGERPHLMLFVAVGLVCVSPLLFGYSIAFTSPAQGTMQGTEPAPGGLNVFTEDMMQLYASLLNLGCVVGAFAGSAVSDRFGRKVGLACAAIPQIIGWAGQSFASSGMLLIGLRIFLGFGVGMGSAITPVYIGEVATTSLRGSLGACNQLSLTIGIFLANFLGGSCYEIEDVNGATYHDWRGLAMVGAAFSTALLVGMLTPITPETPSWLAKQGDASGVSRSLQRVRRGPVEGETREILRTAATPGSEKTATGGKPASGQYTKSYIIGLGLLSFQQFSGVNAIIMYTAQICAQAGLDNPTMAAMVSMLGQVVLTFVSVLLMERAGRRGLLLFGTVCMGCAHFMMAYYFVAPQMGWWGPSWLALCGIGVFLVGFSLGLGPIPWLIIPEIIPTEARGSLSALGTALCWASSFVVTLVFKTLEDVLSKSGAFLLFGIVCWSSFVFVCVLVPETKGKSVEEVIQILRSGRKA